MLKTIIFDLDGTLAHTAPDVLLALNHTLQSYSLQPIAEAQLYELMGLGATFTLEKAFRKQDKILNPEDFATALTTYLTFYRANPVVNSSLYPGVIDTLAYLKNSGFDLGICTNKPSQTAHLVCQKLGLNSFFSAVLCGDEVAQPKPQKQHINEILIRLNGTPDTAMMVGDSEIDEQSAHNSDISFVGVSYGYGFTSFKPEILIHQFSHLIDIINKRIIA